MTYDYRKLETDMLALLTDLGSTLAADEVKEVQAFIDPGEYGLAFETLCCILKDEAKSISPSTRDRLRDLGQTMKISPSDWQDL